MALLIDQNDQLATRHRISIPRAHTTHTLLPLTSSHIVLGAAEDLVQYQKPRAACKVNDTPSSAYTQRTHTSSDSPTVLFESVPCDHLIVAFTIGQEKSAETD